MTKARDQSSLLIFLSATQDRATLRRRFPLSLDYLETVYKPLADSWEVYDNGGDTPELIDWGPR